MAVSVPFKRGDTFLVRGTVTNNNVVQDLTGWTLRSQIRDGNTLVADLLVTYVDRINGIYELSKSVTTTWPAKTLSCDIEYTMSSGQILSTETFSIACAADITRT